MNMFLPHYNPLSIKIQNAKLLIITLDNIQFQIYQSYFF